MERRAHPDMAKPLPKGRGEDVPILRNLKLFRINLVILISMLSLITISSIVWGDGWVKIGSDEVFTQYCNSSSVKIDKRKKTIEVWLKLVFTDKGKSDFIEKKDNISKQKYIDVDYQLKHYLLNYNEFKSKIIFISFNTKTDKLLFHRAYIPEWKNIIPDTLLDKLTNQLVKDYNLKN
jgi:hypothetical protein